MGLFDGFSSVRTQKTTDLSPAESFAGIMLATLSKLCNSLMISQEKVKKIIEVMIIKNKG